jgi:hypothetical protein
MSLELRARLHLQTRGINLNAYYLSKELLECPIRKVEHITATHAQFAFEFLFFDVCKTSHSSCMGENILKIYV